MMLATLCTCCQPCQTTIAEFSSSGELADFDQRSGTWSISGGRLRTSNDNALLIRKDLALDNIRAYVDGMSGSASIRLILGYLDDNNYHYGEFEPNFSPGFRIRLYEVSGGVTTMLAERVQNGGTTSSYTVALCYGFGLLGMSAVEIGSTAGVFAWWYVDELAGTLGGIGTGVAMSPTTIDELWMYKHGSTFCPGCDSGCCRGPIPHTMRVVIDPFTDCPPPGDEGGPVAGTYLLDETPDYDGTRCFWERSNPGTFSGKDVAQWPGTTTMWGHVFTPVDPPLGLRCDALDEWPLVATKNCGGGVTRPITGTITAIYD